MQIINSGEKNVLEASPGHENSAGRQQRDARGRTLDHGKISKKPSVAFLFICPISDTNWTAKLCWSQVAL